MTKSLYIKNMVCDRCVAAVKVLLTQHGIDFENVKLGEVTYTGSVAPEQLQQFKADLEQQGFGLIEDKTARLVNQIKQVALAFVRGNEENRKYKFSAHLAAALDKDYNYLSSLFSALEGTTIEHYLISQKIERVKELLVYDELTLSEIAHQLGYSSVQHLANQFKKETGLTPGHFKKIGAARRKPLDKV